MRLPRANREPRRRERLIAALLLMFFVGACGGAPPAPPSSRSAKFERSWWEPACEGLQPLQVGHDVTPPQIVHHVEPQWEANAIRVEGVIVLEAAITESGVVCDTRVVKTFKGAEPLSAAATAAVKQWRFRPAMKDGKAVASIYTVTVRVTRR